MLISLNPPLKKAVYDLASSNMVICYQISDLNFLRKRFLTSSKANNVLIAAKSNLMTRRDWPIFGELAHSDSASLLEEDELLFVSSSEVPIPSSA